MSKNAIVRNWHPGILAGLVVIYFLGYSLWRFLAAGRDDTFIILWAGQTLGHAPWFVNMNYATQEIASSVLGVLIAALTKGMTVGNALMLVKLLGLIAGAATLLFVWGNRARLFSGRVEATWLALATVLATAVSPVFQYWSLGGLETPYHALLLVVFSIVFVQSIMRKGATGQVDWPLFATGSLLILVRTEAFWPVVLAAATLPLVERFTPVHRSTTRAVYGALGFFALLLGLRYGFTGALWPNPVYAKVGRILDAVPIGWAYLLDYYKSSPWQWVHGLASIYGLVAVARIGVHSVRREWPGERLMYEGIIGATVLCHQLFVVLSGGNWMEYYRFMAAIVPLLNILVLGMVAALVDRLGALRWGAAPASRSLLLVAAVLSLSQIGRAGDAYAGNCARPMDIAAMRGGIEPVSGQLIRNNCAHARDWSGIKPFIEQELPRLVAESGGRLTVVSYQAGFFPYFLRQRFTEREIWFIDSVGLNELEVARLPGRRTSIGLIDGTRIDLALRGEAGPLSDYLKQRSPDLVYLLGADAVVRANFASLGYRIVWDVPGAIVFQRSHPEGERGT